MMIVLIVGLNNMLSHLLKKTLILNNETQQLKNYLRFLWTTIEVIRGDMVFLE